jgi:hypothetical protein
VITQHKRLAGLGAVTETDRSVLGKPTGPWVPGAGPHALAPSLVALRRMSVNREFLRFTESGGKPKVLVLRRLPAAVPGLEAAGVADAQERRIGGVRRYRVRAGQAVLAGTRPALRGGSGEVTTRCKSLYCWAEPVSIACWLRGGSA